MQMDYKTPRSPILSLHRGTVHEWNLQFERLLVRSHHRRMFAFTRRVGTYFSPLLFLVNRIQNKIEFPATRVLHARTVEVNVQLEKHLGGFLSLLIGPRLGLIVGNVAFALYRVRFPLGMDTERDIAHRNRIQLCGSSIGNVEAHLDLCA
jgi:hypothetical protein